MSICLFLLLIHNREYLAVLDSEIAQVTNVIIKSPNLTAELFEQQLSLLMLHRVLLTISVVSRVCH